MPVRVEDERNAYLQYASMMCGARKQGCFTVHAAPRRDERRVLELRIRPQMRGSIELRLFIDALLSAAEEEHERATRPDGASAVDTTVTVEVVGNSGEAVDWIPPRRPNVRSTN